MSTQTQENQPSNPPENDHDIFLDPALKQNMTEDPLFLLLQKWWRHVAVVSAAIIIGFYAKGVFEENRNSELGAAGDTYANLQDALARMPELESKLGSVRAEFAGAAADKKGELEKKVAEAEGELSRARGKIENVLGTLSETRSPYPELAAFTKGMLSAQAKDLSAASAQLKPDAWKSIAPEAHSQRLLAELSALMFSRAALDVPEQKASAVSALFELGAQGNFVAAGALASLAGIAENAEERAKVKAAIEKFLIAQPEQMDLMQQYLDLVE